MLNEEEKAYKLLEQNDIVSTLINGRIYPELSSKDIDSLFVKFEITRNSNIKSKTQKFLDLLKKLRNSGNSYKFLNYYLLNKDLSKVNNIFASKVIKDVDETDLIVKEENGDRDVFINKALKEKMLVALNNILKTSECQITIKNNSVFMSKTNDFNVMELPLEYDEKGLASLSNIVEKANSSMRNGDYESVITKSRTLIEETLLTVAKKYDNPLKENGNINFYKKEVNKMLHLNDFEPYNVLAKDVLDKISSAVISIGKIRSTNSDSHGTLNKETVTKTFARFILISSIAVSDFYLNLSEYKK